ncbi:hypothetical protein GCM10027187_40910 [Streptosporangium sandarakinum]|uniref:WhiB family redox-sensing transcriptional regulator n=1 Tax=Streptosporangium sandarakinum TaxID=1260955 RepID=A0A852V427_9ACTN|nr:WhiB family transcriptional regulator [Streptosporangium sandarakinum]NYF44577.1 WhiB family redox-sensing transcriptional regulator [Streptosporangium sandarakinum]
MAIAAAIRTWHDDAECRGIDHYVFANDTEPLPDGRPRPPYDDEEAKRYCRRCPVRERCLKDALDRRDFHLTRGGLNSDELRAESRRRVRRAAAAR